MRNKCLQNSSAQDDNLNTHYKYVCIIKLASRVTHKSICAVYYFSRLGHLGHSSATYGHCHETIAKTKF